MQYFSESSSPALLLSRLQFSPGYLTYFAGTANSPAVVSLECWSLGRPGDTPEEGEGGESGRGILGNLLLALPAWWGAW